MFECEWIYVLDLDEGKLEVFEGSVEKKASESTRFNDIEDEFPSTESGENGEEIEYVLRLAKSFNFDELPATPEEFAKIIRDAIKERNGEEESKTSEGETKDDCEEEEGLSATGTISATTESETATEASTNATTVLQHEPMGEGNESTTKVEVEGNDAEKMDHSEEGKPSMWGSLVKACKQFAI